MTKYVYDRDKIKRGTHRRLLNYALAEAADGNVQKLVAYLRAGIAPTEQSQLDALADLLQPPVKKKVGRPKGRDPSQRAKAVRMIVNIIRGLEQNWKMNNPNKPFRERRKLIAEFMNRPDGDGDFWFPREITEEEIYAQLTRGGSSQKTPN